jgi:hypothetical protein
MIDLDRMAPGATPLPADFSVSVGDGTTWAPGPAPLSVSVRRGAGAYGSDRVTLIFADDAVRDRWMRVTVLPTTRTRLASAEVFQFGNLVGDATGDGRVDARDVAAVRRALGTAAAVDNPFDFDRNGRVDARDLATALRNQRHELALVIPSPVAPSSVAAATATRGPARRATFLVTGRTPDLLA